MDWEWDSGSYKRAQIKNVGIKKLKDEWMWQTVKLEGGQPYSGQQVGMLFEDETYPCGFCQGSGEKPKGSRCPVCRGAGSVSIEPPAVRCAYCKGRGEEKPRSNVTCTACKGKGVIHVDEPVETCFHCRGTGKEPTNKLVCITCRGKGVVTVKDEEEESWEETQSFDSLQGRLRIPLSDSEGWEPVRSASGSERDALKIVKALGQADRVAVAKGMRPPISSDYAKQLCDALVRKKLLLRHGLIYTLSPNGEKALE